jgi:hypothetical protein
LREADFFSQRNRLQVESWNSGPLDHVQRTIHDVIAETALRAPIEEAVCSWDGSLSYQRLYEHASRVAQHLIGLGVGAEVVVPLCFDKEKWNVVAVLAVLLAGGCCKFPFSSVSEQWLMLEQSYHLTQLLQRNELNISSTRLGPKCCFALEPILPRSVNLYQTFSLLMMTLSIRFRSRRNLFRIGRTAPTPRTSFQHQVPPGKYSALSLALHCDELRNSEQQLGQLYVSTFFF